MLPGEAQKVEKIESSIGKEGTIELPVLHEQTAAKAEAAQPMRTEKEESASPNLAAKSSGSESPGKEATCKQIPHFKPKKFTQFKVAKWEPTTDSEVSDHEILSKGNERSKYYEERKDSYSKFQPSERSPSPQSQCSLSPRGSISASVRHNLLGNSSFSQFCNSLHFVLENIPFELEADVDDADYEVLMIDLIFFSEIDCDPKSSAGLRWASVAPPTKRGEN